MELVLSLRTRSADPGKTSSRWCTAGVDATGTLGIEVATGQMGFGVRTGVHGRQTGQEFYARSGEISALVNSSHIPTFGRTFYINSKRTEG